MESLATKRLEALYQVRDEQAVFAFLDAHTFLVPLLFEAHSQIKVYFPDAQLFLEMFIDPDTVGVESLILEIVTSLDVDAALTRLNALDDGWWINQLDLTNGKLHINVGWL